MYWTFDLFGFRFVFHIDCYRTGWRKDAEFPRGSEPVATLLLPREYCTFDELDELESVNEFDLEIVVT